MKINKILLFGIVIIFLINVLTPTILSEENPRIIYVNDDGDKDYEHIQQAINNASSGDTIYVFNGSYVENILVNKSIMLIGEDKKTTVIDGYIFILDDMVKISEFTINNPHDASAPTDNGIEIWSNYSIITNNIISNNNDGIYIYDFNNNLLYHNNFINNTRNAYDEGNNTWYNLTLNQGNYWDDYHGTDKNNDGIGDTPYNFSSNVQDNFPLMNPYQGRIIIDKFYVDEFSVQLMLLVGMIATIIFCIPIGLWWRKKYFK